MKIQIDRDVFINGLLQGLNVVGVRASLPILSNVLLKTHDNLLDIITTNLDIGIRCTVSAKIKEEGSIALPARKLASIVKVLPEGDVFLDSTETHANLTCGQSKFKIIGLNPQDFPALPAFSGLSCIKIEQQKLRTMLRYVSFARSDDENRRLLNGVLFSFTTKENSSDELDLNLVATDGRRLSVMQQSIKLNGEFQPVEFILPTKTVIEIERLLQPTSSVKIFISPKQVAFELDLSEDLKNNGLVDTIYLISKKVEGKFPNYQQVIPKENDQHVRIDRALLLESIQRVALVSSLEDNTVKLNFKTNLLEISASSAEFGEANESIAIEYSGTQTSIAFNSRFLVDPLKAIQSDDVFFDFKDGMNPGVIKTIDHFLCVVMPLRLQ